MLGLVIAAEFSFQTGSIRSHRRHACPQMLQLRFHSKLVRLEVCQNRATRNPHRCFHSKLVRLEDDRFRKTVMSRGGFHSKLVRLEV